MIEAIPKWIMVRYSIIYREIKCQNFTREKADEIFKKYNLKNDEKLTNVFFSELSKKGWVNVKKDGKDKRRKIFKLTSPEKAILNLNLKE